MYVMHCLFHSRAQGSSTQVFLLSQAPIDKRTYAMGHEACGIAVECVRLGLSLYVQR